LITIKPNPHGQVQVDLANKAGTARLMLYTQQGSLVKQVNRNLSPNEPVVLDPSGLAQGIYLLKVRSGGIERVEKLIIH
jgi:hypothetical protein